MKVKVSLDLLSEKEAVPGKILSFQREGNSLKYGETVILNRLPSVMQQPVYYGTVLELDPFEATVSVSRFADLHRHSDGSLLDGICKTKDLVKLSVPQGALTDHGVLYEYLAFYRGMKGAGKFPVIGCEVYVENLDGKFKKDHLILLVKNDIGYKNLLKLCSNSYSHMGMGAPHVLYSELKDRHEGLIATSACISGTIAKMIRQNEMEKAKFVLDQYISIFGKENFYLEIQRHQIQDETVVEAVYRKWAEEFGLKIIATTDSHYAKKEDAYAHEIALCMQTGKTMAEKHMKFDGTGYHVHTSEEMEDLFSDFPEALENTLELANRCKVNIVLGEVNLPKMPVPEEFGTPEAYFEHLCEEGFRNRFEGKPEFTDTQYLERYNYEMEMIKKMGFIGYFLIVWDYINYARSNGIYVGPGRGSAAGSLLAYCMGITDLDPIKYNLLFERFLNPERVSWPDIDVDFEHSRRGEVIEYARTKYGADQVSHIITFGTEAAKMVIKDVGRVMGYPVSFCAKIAGLVPVEPGMTINKALEKNPEMETMYQNDADVKKIIDLARTLEGCKRHASQHACGVLISPSSVSDYLPTAMVKDDETGEYDVTSQVVMTECEDLGILKMDFLGLKNLGAIHTAIDEINKKYGTFLDYHDIPMDDRETMEFLAQGNTGGVFQLESPGMTKVITRMFSDIDTLPDEDLGQGIERLIAAVALYRPGPMDFIDDYIDGMRHQEHIRYDCPELESILKPTYGQIIYQEEVMQIVQTLAGYSMGRADVVRKAMGKKKLDIMAKERDVFIYGNKKAFDEGLDPKYAPGCIANGIPEETAILIWDKMADFAKYAFNRSHAACYAFIAMITAWLSCHYPVEFYTGMLNAFNDNSEKLKLYLSHAHHRGIKILPPDVNASQEAFSVEGDAIRFGLRGIKGIKGMASCVVVERNAHGPFTSFQSMVERMHKAGTPIEKKSFEGLLYSGGFDCFGYTKQSLLDAFPKINASVLADGKKIEGQVSLFDVDLHPENAKYTIVEIEAKPEMDERHLFEKEFEMLGFYLSGHPADELEQLLAGKPFFHPISELMEEEDTIQKVKTIGMIKEDRTIFTRTKNEEMHIFKLESRDGDLSCVLFPKNVPANKLALVKNAVVCVTGRFEQTERGRQIIVDTIISESAIPKNKAQELRVEIQDKMQQDMLLSWARANPGKYQLIILNADKEYRTKRHVSISQRGIDYLTRNFTAVDF